MQAGTHTTEDTMNDLTYRTSDWLRDHVRAMERRYVVHDDPAALAEADDCLRELERRAQDEAS